MNDQADADRLLKEKHRAMWAQGDYPALASELIPDLGAILVEACGSGRDSGCWTSAPAPATRQFPRP